METAVADKNEEERYENRPLSSDGDLHLWKCQEVRSEGLFTSAGQQ